MIRRADGSFAIVDFGSVRDQLKPEGGSTVVGTFGYMAPEQFQGRSLPGSDVYAVGATALSLVTGREPEELPHRGLAIDVPAALGRGAEPWLVRALSSMLEPDPDKRVSRVPAPGSGRRAPASARASTAPTARAGASSSNHPDFEAIRDQGRELRQRIKDENKNLRRELKAQVREETRRVRREVKSFRRSRRDQWQRHRHGFGPAAPLLIAVVVLALTVARTATWALFRVFLPTLLGVLSLFFGRPLRRAAYRCREVGMTGDVGLQHAMRLVRGRMLGQELEVEGEELDAESPAPPTTRSRVSTPPVHAPPEADDLADFDEKLAEHTRRESR